LALNFPTSPVDGQIYYDSTSGNRYVYDATATKWKYAANNDPYTGTSNTQILFNNQGAITGNAGLTFSANTLYANTVNVTGYIYGNGAFLTGVASDLTPAFNKANSAYTVANAAFNAANNAVTDFSPAFNKANGAYTVANAAFNKANAAVTISNTAPSSPTVGALWWDLTNATMYVYYNDGDSSQWVPATPENDADWATVVNIYNITNTAFNVANAAYTSANNVAPQVTPAFDKANGAYTVANAAYIQANVTAPIAVSAYTTANAAYNQANADFTLAAAAFTVANSAFGAANNVAPQVTPAFNTANAAYTVANAAYNAANDKISSIGGTITGDLSIVGTLIVTGNSYQYNSNTMVVSDPLIYLAANNYTTDLVDIGFIANYVNTGGANVHTGLYREHTNKEYYLFQGYDAEPINNHIGALSNNMILSVLNTDVRTSNLNLGGANAIVWISSAFGVANAAYGNANTGLVSANNYAGAMANAVNAYTSATYSTIVQLGSNWGVTNAAFGVANSSYDYANSKGYFAGNNGDKGNATGLGDIFRVHSNTLSQNVTIYSGNNATATGPLTVTSGKTLTIQIGARVAIV